MVDEQQQRGALDPSAAAFLEQFGSAFAFPESGVESAEEIAAYLDRERSRLGGKPGAGLLGPAEREVATWEHSVGDGIGVRSYVPAGHTRPRPVVIYLHGGGFVSGGLDQHDTTCRILAAHGDLIVLNVDYRLAPEHTYPIPLDDCEAVLDWVRASGADLLGADASRVILCGSSAGGNLAAALALRARQRGASEIALQVLLYPMLDPTLSGRSYLPEVNGSGYVVSTRQVRWYWDRYRGTALDDDEFFAPLAAPDLRDAAPAIIVTAGYDPLRDEGDRYRDRLTAAGVPVRWMHFPGQVHGFMGFFDTVPEALPAVRELAGLIRSTLEVLSAREV